MVRFLPLILALLAFAPFQAQAQTAGAACTTAGQFHESGTESLICDASVWKPVITFNTSGKISFQVGNDAGSCTSVKTGRMRYSSSTWEYCNGAAWQAFNVSSAGECNIANQAVGYVCPNGSVFAGFVYYAASYQPIFATRCDAGQTWNGSACTGTRITLPWNNGNAGGIVATTADNLLDGRANANTLLATDSDSGTGGTQPHQAAAYCDNLVMHGKSDWFLPGVTEMSQLIASQAAIGNFATSATDYWASFEFSYGNPSSGNTFSYELTGANSKNSAQHIRCVRGP